MSKLLSVATGSTGNAYIFKSNVDALMIECGVPAHQVLDYNDWNVKGVAGILVTHGHHDHAKFIPQFQRYGIPIYSTPSCAEANEDVIQLNPYKRYHIGTFTVTPIPVEHNAECYAYVIDHEDTRLLFATDLCNFPYKVGGVTALALECNYASEIVARRMMDGEFVRSGYQNHCELSTAINIINRFKTSLLNKVVLIHLSNDNSDEAMFRERIFSETGIHVEFASTGTIHDLGGDF